MINVNSLNKTVEALKVESESKSISPKYLADILTKVSDLISMAVGQQDLNEVVKLQKLVVTLKQKINSYILTLQGNPTVITNIEQGQYDRNNVYLNATKLDVAFGHAGTLTPAATIQSATESRAGVMRAQQVSDLIKAVADIRVLTAQLNLLNNKIEKVASETNALNFATHIECRINLNDGLHISGASQLIARGFVPYIFRYSRKKCRYRLNQDKDRRKGPKMKGWNVFCDATKIKISNKDVLMIAQHGSYGVNTTEYFKRPELLFAEPKAHYDADGNYKGLFVGYGCDQFCISHGHRFRFAIAFSLPQKTGLFDFSQLVTNLAEFGVYAQECKGKPVFAYCK